MGEGKKEEIGEVRGWGLIKERELSYEKGVGGILKG